MRQAAHAQGVGHFYAPLDASHDTILKVDETAAGQMGLA